MRPVDRGAQRLDRAAGLLDRGDQANAEKAERGAQDLHVGGLAADDQHAQTLEVCFGHAHHPLAKIVELCN